MKTSDATKPKTWLWGLTVIGLLVAIVSLAGGYLGQGFLGEYFEQLSELLQNPERLSDLPPEN